MLEYLFCVIDFSFMLYFFHKLRNEKINKIKFVYVILLISTLQTVFEMMEVSRSIASIRDDLLIVVFLALYDKRRGLQRFVDALLIDSLFQLTISFCIIVAYGFSADIQLSLQPGLYRIVFTLILKVVLFLAMWIEIRQLKKLEMLVNQKAFMLISTCFGVVSIMSAVIMQLSETGNQLLSIVLLNFIIIFLMGCAFYYSVRVKEKGDLNMYRELFVMVEKNVDLMANEKKEIQKLMHDTKNHLMELDAIAVESGIDQIHSRIQEWQKKFFFGYITPICLNGYIDHILRCKIDEYSDIQFNLKLSIPECIPMSVTDLMALFTIVIDQSCRQLKDNQFHTYCLEVLVRENELEIFEQYPNCQQKINDYEMYFKDSFIKNIVEKYHGAIYKETTKETFQRSILLFLEI